MQPVIHKNNETQDEYLIVAVPDGAWCVVTKGNKLHYIRGGYVWSVELLPSLKYWNPELASDLTTRHKEAICESGTEYSSLPNNIVYKDYEKNKKNISFSADESFASLLLSINLTPSTAVVVWII